MDQDSQNLGQVHYQLAVVLNRLFWRFGWVGFLKVGACFLEVSKSVIKIKIFINSGVYLSGTGFFLRFLINGKFFYWLVTNEHVITKEMINNKKVVYISYNIERKNIDIKLDESERYIKTFKDNQVDATVIKILPKDYIYKDYF